MAKKSSRKTQESSLDSNPHDFDASAAGQAQLDSMSATRLLVELFGDIQRGTRLRHDFSKALSEHGLGYALRTAGTRAPHRLVDAFEGIRAYLPQLPSLGLTIEEAKVQNAKEIDADLRELAQRAYDLGDGTLADRIGSFAEGISAGMVSHSESAGVVKDIAQLISTGKEPQVAEFAKQLVAIYSSGQGQKHLDIERELKSKERKLRSAEKKDKDKQLSTVFGSTLGERANQVLRDVSGVNPVAVAVAGAAVLGFLGYKVVGDWIETRYLQNDLHNRTLYAIEAGQVMEPPEGFASVVPVAQRAGNITAAMDRVYMASEGGEPFPLSRLTLLEIDTMLGQAEGEASGVLGIYGDPQLDRAVALVGAGGQQIARSVSESYVPILIPVTTCTSDGDGGTSCTTTLECRGSTTFWRVHREEGFAGLATLLDGYGMELQDGRTLAEQHAPVLAEGVNLENGTVKGYNTAAESLNALPGQLARFQREWPTVPGSHSEWSPFCAPGSWWVDSMVDELGWTSSRVSSLQQVEEHLGSYLETVHVSQDTLQGRQQGNVADELGDRSIDILRALDYPNGRGHLYKPEIEGWVTAWRWGMGIIGVLGAGGLYYLHEKGKEGRRYREYGSYR
ncbi:hypothetical protein J4439_07770 [Candidatus Woesearchaeota archaeon]|nr:hypothetical protein [Candidatus Woesearchaeota archaeon]